MKRLFITCASRQEEIVLVFPILLVKALNIIHKTSTRGLRKQRGERLSVDFRKARNLAIPMATGKTEQKKSHPMLFSQKNVKGIIQQDRKPPYLRQTLRKKWNTHSYAQQQRLTRKSILSPSPDYNEETQCLQR